MKNKKKKLSKGVGAPFYLEQPPTKSCWIATTESGLQPLKGT